ncbi:MAG: DUF2470 domain-containing protein, partial [Mycobacterium sp.]
MFPLSCPAPTTAERIRSACVRAGGALLALEKGEEHDDAHADPVAVPMHHLLHDGSIALAFPADRDRSACRPVSGSQAVLELNDYAPLPLREPVRSLVWVRGRLQHVAPDAVATMLDQIAAECPNPVLLEVDTPRSVPCRGPEPRYT